MLSAYKGICHYGIVILLLALSPTAFAVRQSDQPEFLKFFDHKKAKQESSKGMKKLELRSAEGSVNPFEGGLSAGLRALTKSLDESVSEILRNDLYNLGSYSQILQLKSKNILGLNDNLNTKNYQVQVNHIPFCSGGNLKAHQSKLGRITILGKLPELNSGYIPSIQSDSGMRLRHQNLISNSLKDFDQSTKVKFGAQERCWMIDETGNLEQVEAYHVKINGLSNKVFVSAIKDQIVSLKRLNFAKTVNINTYVRNPDYNAGELADFSVTTKDDQDKLESSVFAMDPQGVAKAEEADDDFTFDPIAEADHFKEATAFAHINEHYDYFKTLGFAMSGFLPLTVYLNAGSIDPDYEDNAFYSVETDSFLPYIMIGNGLSDLQGLALDEDVVSHEFGHHVLYQVLNDVAQGYSETGALHEGLADFFANSKQGNPEIGESICRAGSAICLTDDYLRTADNDYLVDDPTLEGSVHLMGMVISGFLYDLQTQHGISSADVQTLAYKGVYDYLVGDSGFRDFLLGLFLADQDNFSDSYVQEICAEADERGMMSYIADLDCGSGDPLVNIPNPKLASSSSGGSNSKKGGGGGGGCGVVSGIDGNQSKNPLSLFLLIVLPLAVIVGSRQRRQTVM